MRVAVVGWFLMVIFLSLMFWRGVVWCWEWWVGGMREKGKCGSWWWKLMLGMEG